MYLSFRKTFLLLDVLQISWHCWHVINSLCTHIRYQFYHTVLSSAETANCDNVLCTNWSTFCPSDSVRVPVPSGLTHGSCCKRQESCQCFQAHCKRFKLRCDYSGMKRVRIRTGNGNVSGLCCDVYDCVRDGRSQCPRRLQCPPDITCPPDSERVTKARTPNSCCPDPGYCVCKPCKVKCPTRYFPRLLESGSGAPGTCCPTYECQKGMGYCTDQFMVGDQCVYYLGR